MLITGVRLTAHDLVRIKQKFETANEFENPTPDDVLLLNKIDVLRESLGEEEEREEDFIENTNKSIP